jgi:hypothetical protein
MGPLPCSCKILRSAAFRHAVTCFLITFLLVSMVLAAPVTYTGFTITDGQLGSWKFHNARVYLTLHSDTSYVQQTQIAGVNLAYIGPFPPQQLCTGAATPIGTARVTIIAGEKRVEATFAPDQLFVSLDQINGGVGFGSCGPNGFQPAYPLGISGGTIFGAVFAPAYNPSPELAALSLDLKHDTAFSGHAWICVGFPTFGNPCSAPNPLKTDKGDLLLSQPYQVQLPGTPPSYGDPLSGGLFSVEVGERNPWEVTRASRFAPITYNALLVSDVTLGRHSFKGAIVYLSFAADTDTVVPFTDATSSGYFNPLGRAKVTILAGWRSISAEFAPGQIYIYLDVKNSVVGFGSNAGGRGYPLSLTATQPPNSIYGFENSTLGAVADIMRIPADAANYSPLTQSLVTDLTNATTLSGNASSCGALDPATAICSSLVPTRLETNRGSFYLYEPYTNDASTTRTQPYSDNFGIFWTEKGHKDDDWRHEPHE